MKSSFKKPFLYAFLLLFFGAGGYIFFSKPALSSVDQHKKWGVEFYEKRDFERAAVQFRAASRLAPQDLISFYYLALISLEQKEYQKAAAYAGQAIKIDPNSDDGYYYLGKALQGEKKYKEAIRAFSYSNKIKKFPGNYIQKGFCYLKLKKFKKAKKAFVRANTLTPSVSAYFGLARSNYFLRKNDLAL
ncbi:MAG: tetratricopeptide repeat protein, partial [Nitrospinota bacterium]